MYTSTHDADITREIICEKHVTAQEMSGHGRKTAGSFGHSSSFRSGGFRSTGRSWMLKSHASTKLKTHNSNCRLLWKTFFQVEIEVDKYLRCHLRKKWKSQLMTAIHGKYWYKQSINLCPFCIEELRNITEGKTLKNKWKIKVGYCSKR